jgi:hypothetical protein
VPKNHTQFTLEQGLMGSKMPASLCIQAQISNGTFDAVKNAMTKTMTKSWVQTAPLNPLRVGVIAKLRAMIENQVPLGYQDEGGFHYGVKTANHRKPLS